MLKAVSILTIIGAVVVFVVFSSVKSFIQDVSTERQHQMEIVLK